MANESAGLFSELMGLDVPTAPSSAGEVIRWWEARRLHYNCALVLAGFASLVGYFVIVSLPQQFGGTDIPGLFMLAQGILLLVGANIFYTGGWITEVAVRALVRRPYRRFGPIMFGIGLLFSLLIVALPTVGIGVYWVENATAIPLTVEEIAGQYRSEEGFWLEELTLRPDGTYDEVHTISADLEEQKSRWSDFRPGTAYRNSGHWKYDITGVKPQLTLEQSLFMWSPNPDKPYEPPKPDQRIDASFRPHRQREEIVLDGDDPDGFIILTKVR
ncbi:MAG: hypothetical protein M1305_02415 [Candidatus Marsarchaeota archaeon]|nr:hypothetical protein [Candidatus Marsarchaeota archaeon]